MTASELLLDASAWVEILWGTATGRALARRYLRRRGRIVHTSAITVGELSAKLSAEGSANRIRSIVARLRGSSRLHDVTAEIAETAGALRTELRAVEPRASLADAIVLATARRLGVPVVSSDACFAGQKDVIAF